MTHHLLMGLSGFGFIFCFYQIVSALIEAKVLKGICFLILFVLFLLSLVFLALTPDF